MSASRDWHDLLWRANQRAHSSSGDPSESGGRNGTVTIIDSASLNQAIHFTPVPTDYAYLHDFRIRAGRPNPPPIEPVGRTPAYVDAAYEDDPPTAIPIGDDGAMLHIATRTYSNQVGNPITRTNTEGQLFIRRLFRITRIKIKMLTYTMPTVAHQPQCIRPLNPELGDSGICFCGAPTIPKNFVKTQIQITEQYLILQNPEDPMLHEAIPTQNNA